MVVRPVNKDGQLQQDIVDDLAIQALHTGCGSNENFRHLQHCSEDGSANQVVEAVMGGSQMEQLQSITPSQMYMDSKKFNAVVNQYLLNTRKETLMTLESMIKLSYIPVVKSVLNADVLKALEEIIEQRNQSPPVKYEPVAPDLLPALPDHIPFNHQVPMPMVAAPLQMEETKEVGPHIENIHALFLNFKARVPKQQFYLAMTVYDFYVKVRFEKKYY